MHGSSVVANPQLLPSRFTERGNPDVCECRCNVVAGSTETADVLIQQTSCDGEESTR
jgi:hypothetical protein